MKDEMLSVGRDYCLKSNAMRDARWMKKHGAKSVRVFGKRGGPWHLRAQMPIVEFANFCSMEAHRECKK